MFRLFPHLRDVSSFIRSLFLRGSPLFISRLSSGIIFRDLILNLDKSLKNQLQKQKSFLFDKLSDDPIATFLLLSSWSLLIKLPILKSCPLSASLTNGIIEILPSDEPIVGQYSFSSNFILLWIYLFYNHMLWFAEPEVDVNPYSFSYCFEW